MPTYDDILALADELQPPRPPAAPRQAPGQRQGPGPRGGPAPGGRRRSQRPPSPITVHGTLVLVGTALGTFVGLHALMGARALFGTSSNLIDHLPWLVTLLGLALMGVVKSQMDAIRDTVFLTRRGGETQQVRVRRRPEVIWTICKRGLVALAVGILMLGLIDYGVSRYHGQLGLPAPRAGLPAVGTDVFLVLYAVGAAALTLLAAEATLRLTQKEGMAHQAVSLFVPAVVVTGLCMHWIPK